MGCEEHELLGDKQDLPQVRIFRLFWPCGAIGRRSSSRNYSRIFWGESSNLSKVTMKDIEQENEELKEQLIDLQFELNYNKQDKLLEFLRELYDSLDVDRLKEYSKEEIIRNLKDYIDEFVRNNKIRF